MTFDERFNLINNEQEYLNSMGNFYYYNGICKNESCEEYDFEKENVDAETVYPYIFCGKCGEQITYLKEDGTDEWVTIPDAFTFFARIGTI